MSRRRIDLVDLLTLIACVALIVALSRVDTTILDRMFGGK